MMITSKACFPVFKGFLALGLLFLTNCQTLEAQVLNNLAGDYGGTLETQYSPNDPSTRSRLFNLQTGHAGAFYNCDGEEDKRHSPYICWKTGPSGEKFHRPILDVINWKWDKKEIAQRICDGAGACCNGGSCQAQRSTVISTANPCGCKECLAVKSDPSVRVAAAQKNKATGSFRKRDYINSNSMPQVPSHENVSGVVANTVPSVLDGTPVKQSKLCDCAKCKADRAGSTVRNTQLATETPSEKPVATSRSASLLDRARSSRKQR